MSFGTSIRRHNHTGSPGWGLIRGCSWPGPQISSRARSNQTYSTNGLRLGLTAPEQPLGRASALSRLGAELELRRSGSSLGPSQ